MQEIFPIEETPFTVVGEQETGYFIVVGNRKVSEEVFNTKEEAEKYIAAKPWKLICNTMIVISNFVQEQQKESKE